MSEFEKRRVPHNYYRRRLKLYASRITIMGVQAPPGGGGNNATTQPVMTNLRTAANSDKDDDPSALVPIPIATLGSTSIAEQRDVEGRTTFEVVRLCF